MHFPIKFGASKIEEPLKVPYTDDQSKERIIQRLLDYYADAVPGQEIVIVCIGTDRSTGDSRDPWSAPSCCKWGSAINIYSEP